MVKNYQKTGGERSITTKAKKYCTEINLVFNDLFNKDKHQVKYTIKQHTTKKENRNIEQQTYVWPVPTRIKSTIYQ